MNQPTWVDTLLGAIGVLGFLLAVGLAWIEYRRYRLKLRLFVHCYYVHFSNNQEYVVEFRLSFVNPSSSGKIVNETTYTQYFVDSGTRNKSLDIAWKEPKNQYDIFLGTVTYELPNGKFQRPFDKMLQYPLDIPPHQSENRWLLLVLKAGDKHPQHVPIQFHALDTDGKLIASKKLLIPLENLKNVGIYYPNKTLYYSPLHRTAHERLSVFSCTALR